MTQPQPQPQQPQQQTQESLFADLLKEANQQFTPHFFGNLGKTPEAIVETKSRLSKLSDSASNLKINFLKKIQPEGQLDKLKTKDQIDAAYDILHKNIEAKNEFLKSKDDKTKKEIEALQKEIQQNKMNQSQLQDQLVEAERKFADGVSSTKVTTKPGAIADTSDKGIILQTKEPIARMKTLVPVSK
jgi:hypothetical protein